MKRKILALGVLLLSMVGVCSADQCRIVNGQTVCQTAQVQTVVTQPVITTSAVALPIYGAAYQAQTGDDETKLLLRQLLEEMKAMRADLSKGNTVPGTLELRGVDVAAVLKASCASCHTGDKAKGGFQMYTDRNEIVKLSPADRREVLKRVASGNMPPPPKKLTVQEKDAIAKELK